MHHRTVERLAMLSSPVHRLDPRVKLPCVLAFVVLVSLLPARPHVLYAALAAAVAAGIAAARLPWGFVLSRLGMLMPFVLMVGIFWPFFKGTEVLGRFEPLDLVVYREGVELGLALIAKGALAIGAVTWLILSTPFDRLLGAMRAIGLPRVVVATLSFLFRYLDLLADESQRVRRARRLRSPFGQRRWGARSTGGMVGRLFVRAVQRSERIYQAMLARGFEGEVRLLAPLRMRRVDRVFAGAFTVVLGIVVAIAWPWRNG